jgi:hypothetical protein
VHVELLELRSLRSRIKTASGYLNAYDGERREETLMSRILRYGCVVLKMLV